MIIIIVLDLFLIKKNNGKLENVLNSPIKTSTINAEKLIDFSAELCDNSSCNNKVISFEDVNLNIIYYLLLITVLVNGAIIERNVLVGKILWLVIYLRKMMIFKQL